jgi:hypothetical protein
MSANSAPNVQLAVTLEGILGTDQTNLIATMPLLDINGNQISGTGSAPVNTIFLLQMNLNNFQVVPFSTVGIPDDSFYAVTEGGNTNTRTLTLVNSNVSQLIDGETYYISNTANTTGIQINLIFGGRTVPTDITPQYGILSGLIYKYQFDETANIFNYRGIFEINDSDIFSGVKPMAGVNQEQLEQGTKVLLSKLGLAEQGD